MRNRMRERIGAMLTPAPPRVSGTSVPGMIERMDPMTGSAPVSRRDDVLVPTGRVAALAGDERYVIVEVDEDPTAYEGGHIPGAIAWHWRDDLHASPRRDFIGQDDLVALLRRSGVGPDTTVVLYGGNNNWFA